MFLLQLSIILQLTGALDVFAGVVIAALGFKFGMLTSGAILVVLGAGFFLVGRLMLKRALRRRYSGPSLFAGASMSVPQQRVRPSYFVDSAGQATPSTNGIPNSLSDPMPAERPVFAATGAGSHPFQNTAPAQRASRPAFLDDPKS